MEIEITGKGKRLNLAILLAIGLGITLIFMTGSIADKPEHDDSNNSPVPVNSVTDVDGNVYTTVKIGNQIWMVENLKVTHYRDSSVIPNIINDTIWSTLTTGAYSWYANDSTNKDSYGALYNFYAVIDSCGLCPEGWHIPTESEWLALEAYLGGRDIAGGKMKEAGTAHWTAPNVGATGESGFLGLPGGGRGRISGCGEIGNNATWWASTAYDSIYAWHFGLYHGNTSIRSNPGHKASGFSVRCVKDPDSPGF